MDNDSHKVGESPAASYRSREAAAKVRTQIYLSEDQRDFLNRESSRTGLSMAELIRQYIDAKRNPGADAWENNPLLSETPEDPDFEGHPDGSTNTDAILYGTVSE